MPPIYVNTEHSLENKLYDATAAGERAGKLETKMQGWVQKVIEPEADFTTNKMKSAKGYTLKMKISSIKKKDGNTIVNLTGEMIRYPLDKSSSKDAKDGKGEGVVSTEMTAKSTASGEDPGAVDAALEDATKKLTKASFDYMKKDMKNR
jgi:hypothetical protein